MRKFLIHCPGNSVAGGAESLHQFGDCLNSLGEEAYMCYYPYNNNFFKPNKFSSYNIKEKKFYDNKNLIHIFPEIYTKASLKVKKGKIGIFWLSIDNYYGYKDHNNLIKKNFMKFKLLYKTRIPIFMMKNYFHLYQSHYSKSYLKKYKLKGFFIGDYIKNIPDKSFRKKEKKILFNPRKGKHITDQLIKKNKDLTFIPLENLSENEMFNLMKKTAIYIDFGNHPGRDRIPREATLNDCILITGRRGSAKNNSDIPIKKKYKLNHKSKRFYLDFKKLVNQIFEDINFHQSEVSYYKEIIKADKRKVIQNVEKFLTSF